MMTKRISLILLFVLVVSLFFASEAFAVAKTPEDESMNILGGCLTYGTLTEKGEDDFTIQTPTGRTFLYQVDATTRFRIEGVDNPSFIDLEIGMNLAVAARIIDGVRVARVVVVTPDDFNPIRRFGGLVRGVIVEINPESNILVLENPSSKRITIQLHERTRFIYVSQSLDDLKVGEFIRVAGRRDENGILHATMILTTKFPRRINIAGEITGVDVNGSTFVVLTRRDQIVTIHVSESTVFHSLGGEIQGLADLGSGMVAVVTGLHQGNRTILAKRVVAGSREDLPDYEVKAVGKILVIGVDFFTLQTKDGDEFTFQVDPDTHFRGRGVLVHHISDLRIGMIALVGGETGTDGELIARFVITTRNFHWFP